MAEEQTLSRAEIDTSAPFESVKEAASRFGELGFWKPNTITHNHNAKPSESQLLQSYDVEEEMDVTKVEEQAAALEKELILKEKDTLEVLKELEATKLIVEELKSKLQTEESNMATNDNNKPFLQKQRKAENHEEEEEKENNPNLSLQNIPENSIPIIPSSSPGLILMELKQAKMNLNNKTSDLAEIRASVDLYNKKIERELISLEKTRERLKSNSSKVSSLEEELNRTKQKLEKAKDGKENITEELNRLSAEAEKYKKMGEMAKSEAMRAMQEIEQTKDKIKTAEVRLVAARKMKEAARAAEAVALAEITALEKSNNNNNAENNNNIDNDNIISMSIEEYSCLRSKAEDAEENCNMKVLHASVQVEEANESKMDVMKRVEETLEEVKASKKVLEEALTRVEAANGAKLAVEEALRRWRSEHGEKRRSAVQNNTKFKTTSFRRRDSQQMQMLDVNGITLVNDDSTSPVSLKPASLSIGQILSRKLLVTEEYETGKSNVKRKVSLGQMLGRQNNGDLKEGINNNGGTTTKKLPVKSGKKKFGFARISVLLSNKEGKKKKKPTTSTAARSSFFTTGCKGEQEVNQSIVLKK